MLYVGMDMHKRYSVMTVIDEKGKEALGRPWRPGTCVSCFAFGRPW
jgi:hypothetical protein